MEIPQRKDLEWNEKFTWLWFNSDEIFKWTEEDFDRKAKQLCDNGVTTAITFTCTHFVYSFYPWWDKIHECIRHIVEACHKYGIKVVEHCTSSLTFNPESEEDREYIRIMLKLRKSSIEDFPGLIEYASEDHIVDGASLYSMRQIDGKTGKPARTWYGGNAFCFNNPDYHRVYFDRLRTVFSLGVDGMMNDDMQYWPNACTCPHCRAKFKKQYGYDLPDPEHWDEFENDFDNPAYTAFLRFRYDSTKQFYDEIIELEKECGVHMFRPFYSCRQLPVNWSALPFDSCAKYFSNIFQENQNSSIIRYSYPDFMIEAIHRFAVASKYHVPSMSLFYPNRPDSVYFAWAMARTWGQMYTGTSEGGDIGGGDITDYEKKYREFETKHEHLYKWPKKLADAAIYLSVPTRDYTAYATSGETKPWTSWAQISVFSGLQTDMVFDDDTLERLQLQKLILVPHITMMSDEEILRLRNYAAGGGKLIIIGKCGIRDENNHPRTEEKFREMLGSGNIVYAESRRDEELIHPDAYALRQDDHPGPARYENPIPEMLKLRKAQMLSFLDDKPNVEISDHYLTGLFAVNNEYVLHVTSVRDVLPAEPCEVRHQDLIPGFTEGERITEDIPVICRLPEKVSEIVLHSPSNTEPLTVPFAADGNEISFTLPKGSFGGYALLEFRI